MAVQNIETQVIRALPFLTAAADSAAIGQIFIEMAYLMQTETGKADGDVETEANYSNLELMMFAAMVKYAMAKIQVTKNMEGTSTTGPSTKSIKRAKADVVETEFAHSKASDGARLQLLTPDWFRACISDICVISGQLEYSNPLCLQADADLKANIIPFIIGADFPTGQPDLYETILNNKPIG